MSEHRGIYWSDEAGRLQNYTVATKANGHAVVKIELVIADPFRLGMLLQELQTIKQQQGRPDISSEPVPRPRRSRHQLSSAGGQLLLSPPRKGHRDE
ncbi:hypothetical protein [Ferrovibrio terrae]|uniref:hypothetical protein n=1 Tax=Ferrovibrio terrae TaxID=2594003 RepID=UPI0031377B90